MPLPIRKSVTVKPTLAMRVSKPKAGAAWGNKVLHSAARQNSPINHGHFIFVFAPQATAAPAANGTIHNARASFTVVPITSATAPYLAAAPTTELVSWMASAAHSPNCCCVRCSAAPMAGKISSATELRTKIVPSDTAICSSVAWIIGPSAAMALPPQMAVPIEIKNAFLICTCSSLLSAIPAAMAKLMLRTVYKNPLRPAFSTWCRSMPNPRPTTDTCKRILVTRADSLGNG